MNDGVVKNIADEKNNENIETGITSSIYIIQTATPAKKPAIIPYLPYIFKSDENTAPAAIIPMSKIELDDKDEVTNPTEIAKVTAEVISLYITTHKMRYIPTSCEIFIFKGRIIPESPASREHIKRMKDITSSRVICLGFSYRLKNGLVFENA